MQNSITRKPENVPDEVIKAWRTAGKISKGPTVHLLPSQQFSPPVEPVKQKRVRRLLDEASAQRAEAARMQELIDRYTTGGARHNQPIVSSRPRDFTP